MKCTCSCVVPFSPHIVLAGKNDEKRKKSRQSLDDEDCFKESRIAGKDQSEQFARAKESSQSSFSSFSDGMPTVNKFELVEGSAKSMTDMSGVPEGSSERAPNTTLQDETVALSGNSFQSFSEGMPSVDKFGITGLPPRELSLPVLEYLTSSHFPLADELNVSHSNQLAHTPGLRTLGLVVARICTVPWRDQITVRLVSGEHEREYCFDSDSITIDTRLSPIQQILDFVHQGYHSSNKLLSHLYDGKALSQDEFLDIYLWSEIAALVTEVNAARELSALIGPDLSLLERVFADCQEEGELVSIDVEEFVQQLGLRKLHDYLFESFVRGSHSSLVHRLCDMYRRYVSSFSETRVFAEQLIAAGLKAGLDQESI